MLQKKVLNTIKNSGLIPENSIVIAAVSGGADSVCLLDLLIKLSEKLSFTVECAHVNHNLRGAESDGDEAYVRQLCKDYGVKLHVESVDVKALSQGKSIEDAARQVRYDFFKQLCDGRNAVVATAHTLNDNTETFFINLLRGSSSRGLSGIPIKRDNIIRPLLEVSRNEIIEHLQKQNLEFCTDSTNADTDFLRNFIRHNIVPVFESRNGINIHKSIKKATSNLQKENEALDVITDNMLTENVEVLKTYSDAILYRVLTKKLEKEQGIILDSVHFYTVKSLLYKQSGKEQIQGDIYALCNKGKLSFTKLNKKDSEIYPLTIGENDVSGKKILIKKPEEIYKALTKYCIDCDKISGSLYMRTRKEGDVFNCIGRSSTSKLSKLLKNDNVSPGLRDNIAVICDERGKVVFVENYGADNDVKITNETKNIISIEIKGKI